MEPTTNLFSDTQIAQLTKSFAVIKTSLQATTREDISEILNQVKVTLGCHSIHCLIYEKNDGHTTTIISSIESPPRSPSLRDHLKNKLLTDNPVIKESLESGRAVVWSDSLNHASYSGKYSSYMNILNKFGIFNAVTFPYNGSSNKAKPTLLNVMLTSKNLALSSQKIDNRFIQYMGVLLDYVNEEIIRICFPYKPHQEKYNLTPREVQVLDWASKGKTAWEIASILSISERTVKYYLSKIYSKLNVVNRQQAVAIAVHCGIV